MSGHCQGEPSDGSVCQLLADCPMCLCCWGCCWCQDDDPDECQHGQLKTDPCEACARMVPE